MSDATVAELAARPFQRFRLFGRLTLLVLVPMLLIAFAAVINAENEYIAARQSALDAALVIARQAATRLDDLYDELDQVLEVVGEVGRATLVSGAEGDAPLGRMLAAMPQHVYSLSIIALDGRGLAGTAENTRTPTPGNLAQRRFFRDALARRALAVDEPVQLPGSTQWVVLSARPVLGNNGMPIGVVSMATRMDRFHDTLVPLGLPLGALMTVFNARGTGIASTAEPVAAIGRDFAQSATVRRALRERQFAAQIAASDGQKRLTAYAAGEKLPWIVEVGLPVEQTLAAAREKLALRLGVILAALLIGLMVAYWLARWIANPIHVLTRDAERLGSGDARARTAVSGYHEIDQLGTAFNIMADAVEQKQRDLKKSEERFRSLVLLSSDWYWTQDAEHRFTSHSQGRFGEIALSAGDYRGKTRWEMPGAEPVGTTWGEHQALLDARQSWRDFIVRYVDNAGEEQYISSSGEPVLGEDRVFAGYRGVARLVTERFQLEAKRAAAAAALRVSEAKFRALTALSSDWYWEQDADFRFTYMQHHDERPPLEVLGKTRWETGIEPVGHTWEEHRACLERHETFRGSIYCHRAPDGTTQYLSVSGEAVFDDAGVFRGYRGTSTDVTVRIRLEAQLHERIELFQTTLETTPVAIGLIRRRDSAVLLANSAGYEMFNIDRNVGNWDVLANWERAEDLAEMQRRIKATGRARDMEVPVRVPGRERVWTLLSAQPARYAGDDVLVVTVNDITERKNLEAQREALHTEARAANARLRLLSQQVLDAQESERRQIAHELHDEIGQNLSALKLFAGHLRGGAPPQLHAEIDEWLSVVDRSLAQVRDLSRLLRPVQIDHMGLPAALRALLATQARAAGWVTHFDDTGSDERFDTRIETVCYRLAQEALNNAARHAAAATVTLRLARTSTEVIVEIEDDGRGFDLIEARSRIEQGRSMGLLGIEERVRLAGGRLEIDSAPARGTRIKAVIPLPAAAQTGGT